MAVGAGCWYLGLCPAKIGTRVSFGGLSRESLTGLRQYSTLLQFIYPLFPPRPQLQFLPSAVVYKDRLRGIESRWLPPLLPPLLQTLNPSMSATSMSCSISNAPLTPYTPPLSLTHRSSGHQGRHGHEFLGTFLFLARRPSPAAHPLTVPSARVRLPRAG